MALFRTCIAISGLSAAEAEEGLPELRGELTRRHWMVGPAAEWQPATSRLLLSVGYEVDRASDCAALAHDEVWDCVIACIPAAGDLDFAVEEPARLVSA